MAGVVPLVTVKVSRSGTVLVVRRQTIFTQTSACGQTPELKNTQGNIIKPWFRTLPLANKMFKEQQSQLDNLYQNKSDSVPLSTRKMLSTNVDIHKTCSPVASLM